jgi:phytoene synthase
MTTAPLELASSGAQKSNLAFALARLPRERRRHALVFYNFCRVVDDIADEESRPASEKQALLEQWKSALASGRGLPTPLADVLAAYRIDRHLLVEIILGVEQDIHPHDFPTYADLRTYCWRVACAVGLVSIEIFGCRDPRSKTYAEQLGHALQLTNILRDVGEDARMGRVYLPLEDLARFDLTADQIRRGQPGPRFEELMRFEAERAHEFFRGARAAFPQADARSLAPAEAMRAIYGKILSRMEADHFQVFKKRYRLPLWQKLWLLARPGQGFP